MEETNELKVGDSACITWKKPDGSAIGGTEGLFLGLFGNDTIGKFLVFDRSCYKDSLKASVFSLGIHDLKIIPADDIDIVNRRQLRERPSNSSERFRFIIDAFYYSNIDYQSTLTSIHERKDFKSKVIGNDRAEQYGISITKMSSIEGASINIICNGIIQITCEQKNLDDCIQWLNQAVKLSSEQKRLVLFPKRIAYRLSDSFVEKAVPSEELVNEIASKEGAPIIMPLGWKHKFSEDLGQNPLEGLFSDSGTIPLDTEKANGSSNQQQLNYSRSGVTVEKYLGNIPQLMHLRGLILSPKEEEEMMNMWLKSRLDIHQWFDSGPINGGQITGNVLIHDLTINRKTGRYIVDIRTYSGNQFTNEKANKNVKVRLKV